MKKIFFPAGLFLLLLAAAGLALGQGQGSQGMGMGGLYDPKTVEVLKGEVTALHTATSPMTGVANRLTLDLKTEKETVAVYLGPEDYFRAQNFPLATGDRVEVKGSRITMGGQPVIIPNYIKKGEATLNLWDDKGVPPWSRSRQ
jgi:hypothetical protein